MWSKSPVLAPPGRKVAIVVEMITAFVAVIAAMVVIIQRLNLVKCLHTEYGWEKAIVTPHPTPFAGSVNFLLAFALEAKYLSPRLILYFSQLYPSHIVFYKWNVASYACFASRSPTYDILNIHWKSVFLGNWVGECIVLELVVYGQDNFVLALRC